MAFLEALVRWLYLMVGAFSLLLALLTFHSFYPVTDPMTPVGYIDRLSYLMGVHDENAVVVVELDAWSTTVFTYVFHQRLSDGSFQLASESKEVLMQGIFPTAPGSTSPGNGDYLQEDLPHHSRALDILRAASDSLQATQSGFRLVLQPDKKCPGYWASAFSVRGNASSEGGRCKAALAARVTDRVLETIPRPQVAQAMENLRAAVSNSAGFEVADGGRALGEFSEADSASLDWLAINLANRNLAKWDRAKFGVILDVRGSDTIFTFAVDSWPTRIPTFPPDGRPMLMELSVFKRPIRLVRLRIPGLGLDRARHAILSATTIANQSEPDRLTGRLTSRNGCINPIVNATWSWGNSSFLVLGLENGLTEPVKERTGPLAGRRLTRPVSSLKNCQSATSEFVDSIVTPEVAAELKALFHGHPIYMAGFLDEKCVERGLTLPDKGGDVSMVEFAKSLTDACKSPNTEQPFSCMDMLFLRAVLGKLVGLNPKEATSKGQPSKDKSAAANFIFSSRRVGDVTAQWPLATAFYIYQSGL